MPSRDAMRRTAQASALACALADAEPCAEHSDWTFETGFLRLDLRPHATMKADDDATKCYDDN